MKGRSERERRDAATLIIQTLISLFSRFSLTEVQQNGCRGMQYCLVHRDLLKESHRHYCVVVGPEIGSPHEGSVP